MSTANLILIAVGLVIALANAVAGGAVAAGIAGSVRRMGAARLRLAAIAVVAVGIVAAAFGATRASEKPCQAHDGAHSSRDGVC